jgi:disulfide bond formation protein DsbB
MGARSRNKRIAAARNAGPSESPPSAGAVASPRDRKHGLPVASLQLTAGARKPAEAIERHPESAWILVFAGWLVASVSTLGALFFSEVMQLPPCVLCWYQRIFMFPLVLLLPFGLFPFDRKIVRYALPLVLGGWLISLFHLLLVGGIIPESLKPCTQGVPCTEVQIEWLGFVTIPLLSFVAFSVICAFMIVALYRMSK